MPAGNAYPSGHLVPSPIVGLACAPIVDTRYLELSMSLFDFSPRIPLGAFSILLCTCVEIQAVIELTRGYFVKCSTDETNGCFVAETVHHLVMPL